MPILGEEHTLLNYEYVLISVQNTIGITCVNVCVKQEVVGAHKAVVRSVISILCYTL